MKSKFDEFLIPTLLLEINREICFQTRFFFYLQTFFLCWKFILAIFQQYCLHFNNKIPFVYFAWQISKKNRLGIFRSFAFFLKGRNSLLVALEVHSFLGIDFLWWHFLGLFDDVFRWSISKYSSFKLFLKIIVSEAS